LPPHDEAQDQPEHEGGQQTAGKQRRDRDIGDAADRDQHQARRYGLGLGARRGEQRHEIAGLAASLSHLGKQHRCHGGHVSGL
jgi:hypothetical protein